MNKTVNYIDSINHLRFMPVDFTWNISICEAFTSNKRIFEYLSHNNIYDFISKPKESFYYVYCEIYTDYTIYNAIDIEEDIEFDNHYWLVFDNLYFALKYAISK